MTRAVGADSDAILLLQGDHRTLSALVDRLRRDGRALPRLRSFAHLHARAEEEVLHPALGEAGGDGPLLRSAGDDHRRVLRLLEGVAATRRGSPEFERRLGELRAAVDDHVRMEEGPVFAAALATLPRPTLVALAERIECQRQDAPVARAPVTRGSSRSPRRPRSSPR